MSWQAVKAAFELPADVDPTARFVAVALAFRAGADGRAWPSIACLCADTGYGRAAVQRALLRLAKGKHVGVIHKNGTSSTYTLTGISASPPTGISARPTGISESKKRHPSEARNSKGTDQEQAPSDPAAQRPAVASNGKRRRGDPEPVDIAGTWEAVLKTTGSTWRPL
jgi:hypothetical protein